MEISINSVSRDLNVIPVTHFFFRLVSRCRKAQENTAKCMSLIFFQLLLRQSREQEQLQGTLARKPTQLISKSKNHEETRGDPTGTTCELGDDRVVCSTQRFIATWQAQ